MDLLSNRTHTNRSVPASTVIPVLAYEDVGQAVDWLCRTFGFSERLRIGTHRAQLTFGNGAVIVTQRSSAQQADAVDATMEVDHSLLVRVEDAERHYMHARERGARILQAPADYPYGERQYTVEDSGGHCWTFSQSIVDVDPAEWGGILLTHE